MICIASRMGVTIPLKPAERPARTPSGTPTRSDNDTAASISENVCTDSSQNPIVAKLANAARTPSAALRPPKRRTTSVPRATVPAHVSLWKKPVSQPTRWSRKFAKPLKMLNATFGCGTLRLLLSQAWKRSRYGPSEFHVSAAGQ